MHLLHIERQVGVCITTSKQQTIGIPESKNFRICLKLQLQLPHHPLPKKTREIMAQSHDHSNTSVRDMAGEIVTKVQEETQSPLTVSQVPLSLRRSSLTHTQKAEKLEYRSVLLDAIESNFEESRAAYETLDQLFRAQQEDYTILEEEFSLQKADLFGMELWSIFTNGGTWYRPFSEEKQYKETRERYAARDESMIERQSLIDTRKKDMDIRQSRLAENSAWRKRLSKTEHALRS